MAKKLFRLYLVIFLIIPLFTFFLVGWHSNFKIVSNINLAFALTILSISSFVVLVAARDINLKTFITLDLNKGKSRFLFLTVGFIFLLLSLYMKSNYGISFRHSGPSLSAAGSLAVIFSIFKGIIAPIFIVYARYVLRKEKLSVTNRLNSFIIMTALVLFPVAAFDVIFIFIFMFFCFSQRIGYKLFTMNFIPFIALGIPLAVLVIFMGISTKIGFDNLTSYIHESGFNLLKYLQYRNSVFFFSSLVNFSDPYFLISGWVEGANVTISMLVYRLEVIFGLSPEKLVLGNLNVLNFKNVFSSYESSMEIGASPGLILSFFYVLPFPVSLMILFCFVYFLSGLLNSAFDDNEAGYFLVCCVLVALFGVINNPVHVMTAIGPDIVKLLFLFLSLFINITERKKLE